MPELHNFKSLIDQCESARKQFHACGEKKTSEIDEVFTLVTDVIHSVGQLYEQNELAGTKEEAAIEVLVQAVETAVAMYFMAEDGFWDSSLALKRNYAELMLVAVAIGHDHQCFIDWKHGRQNVDGFSKISKQVEKSVNVPDLDKQRLLPHLKKHWNESSHRWSHNVSRASVRTVCTNGEIKLEPKGATCEFVEQRMSTIRNMLLDVLSVLVAIIRFDERAFERRESFPTGRAIIARINRVFQNQAWQQDPTS